MANLGVTKPMHLRGGVPLRTKLYGSVFRLGSALGAQRSVPGEISSTLVPLGGGKPGRPSELPIEPTSTMQPVGPFMEPVDSTT